jgi:hypothetical protein
MGSIVSHLPLIHFDLFLVVLDVSELSLIPVWYSSTYACVSAIL